MLGRNPRFLKLFLGKKAPAISRTISRQTNVISSKAAKVIIPNNVLIHEFIWNSLDKYEYSNKIATECVETQRSYTYGELYKKSLAISKFLKENLSLRKPDTIGIILPNYPEFPIIFLGTLQAGITITTCNPNYTSEEILRQLIDSKAKAVFTSRGLLTTVQKAVEKLPKSIPIIVVKHDESESSDNNYIKFEEITQNCNYSVKSDQDANDTAVLPYSSGTTGLPKGVELSHYNIVSNLCQFDAPEFYIDFANGQPQAIVPVFIPFFHIYGMVMIMLMCLYRGFKLVTFPKFSSDILIKSLRKHKPTCLFCAPPIVHLIINNDNIKREDLASLGVVSSGAAPLGAMDIDRFEDKTEGKIQLIQAYGMTETSPLTLSQTKNLPGGLKPGGCGFVVANTEAKIISLDGKNSTQGLEANKSGELLFRGPQVMKGYYNNKKATEEIFLEGGWLRTGDIAYYDDHEHFFITDRLKELIKVKGFQVAPAELEEILRDHPCVEDAAVVGVPHPTLGECPKAFVVKKKDTPYLSALKLDEFVSSKVVEYKRLTGGIIFIGKIPKNPSGKILRKELKDL